MFTGLVEGKREIVEIVPEGPGIRLRIDLRELADSAKLGDSIAVSGCCLTVVAIAGSLLDFQAGEETLRCTKLGSLKSGDQVNIERSLKLGDTIGGHLVTGHVDALGSVRARRDSQDWSDIDFNLPSRLAGQVAGKGSIAVDGVSLTVVQAGPDWFSVALIPHTLELTTLGTLTVGAPVHLETDVLAKYVERQLAFQNK